MCAGAAVAARLATVVLGCWEPKTGAAGSLWDMSGSRLPHRVEVRGGVLEASVPCASGSFSSTGAPSRSRPRGGDRLVVAPINVARAAKLG